jgi:ubiquinone/menaquinone biosynthesis C-methylase UbiE
VTSGSRVGSQHPSAFTTVDDAIDPGVFIRWMDEVQDLPDVARTRAAAVDALRLSAGDAVLDVGCGAGDVAVGLAPLVHPGGRVVGLDASEAMVGEARRRTDGQGLPVEFQVGDAQNLPFDDGTFNACRSERVLIHVPDAGRALAEMARVTGSGGRIAVVDIDADATLIDSADRKLTRTIVSTLADSYRNGWIGRQLPRLFREAGLRDVSTHPVTVPFDFTVAGRILAPHLQALEADGLIDAASIRRWRDDLESAENSGTFFLAMTFFVVGGSKPG